MRPIRSAVAAAAVGLSLAMTACGSDDDVRDAGAAPTTGSAAETSAAQTSAEVVPEGPFGPGCSAFPPSGGGSFSGMAAAPVVTASSRNPLLTTLVRAVQAANLVDSLNRQQDVTVLAPANPAFEAIPPNNLQALMGDSARLTALLTHHVIQGRVTPDRLAGTHTTLNNDEVTIEGSGQTFTVPASGTVTTQKPAAVICGNVQTANATVYVVDQVLVPPAG